MMQTLVFSPVALSQLLSLVDEFIQRREKDGGVDLHEVVGRVGKAFGVDDVDAFIAKKIKDAMQQGLGIAFDEGGSDLLATVFYDACAPIMSLVMSFAKGESTSIDLLSGLADICLQSNAKVCTAFQQVFGVPDELASLLADKLGLHLVAVYCFAAVYKIYRKAAQDAAIARERRIEIERMADKSIERLKCERRQMEELVNRYLLDRLVPVRDGIEAMDQAVLDNDDDGFIAANEAIWRVFGRESQYGTTEEFDDLMLSDDVFLL